MGDPVSCFFVAEGLMSNHEGFMFCYGADLVKIYVFVLIFMYWLTPFPFSSPCSCVWSSPSRAINFPARGNSSHNGKYYCRRRNCSQNCITAACIPWWELCFVVSHRKGRPQSFPQPTYGENGCCWFSPCPCAISLCNHTSSISCCWKFILHDGTCNHSIAAKVCPLWTSLPFSPEGKWNIKSIHQQHNYHCLCLSYIFVGYILLKNLT